MKLVSLENITKYNELLNKKIVKSVNSVKPDDDGNILLGTEKSTFNKVVYDTGYFSIGTNATYNFDLAGSDLENVSKENVNIRLVAKVTTAHNGFEVGDIAQLTTANDFASNNGSLDICTYIRGNTLYLRSGDNPYLSIYNVTGWLEKTKVQIKAVLTAFIPSDGSILLIAEDQTNTSKLIGLPDGTLTWGDTNIVPVTGKIEWFAFNTPPDGYLVCNGANVSRETYADLFAVIGTTFGSGDGSTTFNLPDLRNRFAEGAGTYSVGTAFEAGLPNITSSVQFSPYDTMNARRPIIFNATGAMTLSDATENAESIAKQACYVDKRYQLNFNASNSSSIYGNSSTVQPPALTLLPCIKY